MEFVLRGRNIEVTEALKRYVEKKVGRIEKYFDIPLRAQVTLGVERERHIVEVTVPINGMLLRGEEEVDDMYAAIDGVVDKLERQIHKYKTKINRKARQQDPRFTPILENVAPSIELEPDEDEEPRVVKVKRVQLKPMDVDEAILQMNLLGHDFFVFTNAEDARTHVVYRRKDGNYGLIGPEA